MYLGAMSCSVDLAGKYRLQGLESLEIKKSVHQIVQTAKLTLPLSIVIRNNEMLERIKLADKVKEGDKITIAIGYDGNNRTEFEGYVRRINPKQPLEFELEDELYLLRKLHLKKSFKKNDVSELLTWLMEELYSKFQIRFKLYDNIPKTQLTNFLIKGANGIEVLQELKDKYLLATFLTTVNGEKVLYCGLTYGLKKERVKHVINRNTISVENLKYNPAGDRTFNVEVINHTPDGKVKKWHFGDKDGDKIQIYVPGIKTEAELKHRAEAEIELFKTGSYKGSFDAFMIPYCEPGDIEDLGDDQFPDRSGTYYIATVTTTFGNGGMRKPEIDFRTQ